MTPEELRAWRDRRFAGKVGKNQLCAEALGLDVYRLNRRLGGQTPVSRTEALLCRALDALDANSPVAVLWDERE